GLSLFEDLRAFVDHRIDAALQDFGVADGALLDALRLGEFADERLDMRRGLGVARFVVVVEARAVLLAAPALFAEDFAVWRALRGLSRPADVEARQIAHRERPHRHTELDNDPVDVPRRRALENELRRLALALAQHAVAHETVADADNDADLADLRRE